jgi:hypothetical protein
MYVPPPRGTAAGSFRYQYQRYMLRRALHACKEKAAHAHRQVAAIDAQEAPLFTETVDALMVRVATRASIAAIAVAMDQRVTQIERALDAIEAELQATRHLVRSSASDPDWLPTLPLPDILPDDC